MQEDNAQYTRKSAIFMLYREQNIPKSKTTGMKNINVKRNSGFITKPSDVETLKLRIQNRKPPSTFTAVGKTLTAPDLL